MSPAPKPRGIDVRTVPGDCLSLWIMPADGDEKDHWAHIDDVGSGVDVKTADEAEKIGRWFMRYAAWRRSLPEAHKEAT
jgi:hypothetical protein